MFFRKRDISPAKVIGYKQYEQKITILLFQKYFLPKTIALF